MISPRKIKNIIGATVSITAVVGYPVVAAYEYIKDKKNYKKKEKADKEV